MTTDEMRVAIAESLGWKEIRVDEQEVHETFSVFSLCGIRPDAPFSRLQIPPLTLDWLHECEQHLFELEKQSGSKDFADIYDNELAKIAAREMLFFKWHFTATQRAEAYLRTRNLWKD